MKEPDTITIHIPVNTTEEELQEVVDAIVGLLNDRFPNLGDSKVRYS